MLRSLGSVDEGSCRGESSEAGGRHVASPRDKAALYSRQGGSREPAGSTYHSASGERSWSARVDEAAAGRAHGAGRIAPGHVAVAAEEHPAGLVRTPTRLGGPPATTTTGPSCEIAGSAGVARSRSSLIWNGPAALDGQHVGGAVAVEIDRLFAAKRGGQAVDRSRRSHARDRIERSVAQRRGSADDRIDAAVAVEIEAQARRRSRPGGAPDRLELAALEVEEHLRGRAIVQRDDPEIAERSRAASGDGDLDAVAIDVERARLAQRRRLVHVHGEAGVVAGDGDAIEVTVAVDVG